MKKILITLIACVALASCGDYLDVVPDNVATIDYAFRNRTVAEKYLFTCYNYRPVIGGVNVDPAMNGGDETWQRYTNTEQFWPTFANSQIARGFQSVVNPILDHWNGQNSGKALWVGIRDCNTFLEKIKDVRDLNDQDRKRWIAEVKFLKAYYHYYLFKCYGPIPIMDVNIPISTDEEQVKVFRQPIDSVVNYVSNLLAEAITDLPDAKGVVEGTEAGRVDQLAALSIRAELLLFAASPLFNGNADYQGMIDKRGVQLFPQNYDQRKWQLAAAACKAAIDACHAQGKALYDLVDPVINNPTVPQPFKLQTTYRQAICDRWNKELIWGNTNYSCSDLTRNATPRLVPLTERLGAVTSEWAPTLKMAGMYYSSNGVPINEDKEWLSKGWYDNRFKIRPEGSSGNEIYYVKEAEKTAYLHFNREPRFYASLGFDKGIYFGNGYYNFPANVKYCDFLNTGVSGYQANAGHSATGYAVKKMHSFKNAQTKDEVSTEYFPFPVVRLADLYLMYAEALNEADGPAEEIIAYLDLIRARAGLGGVKESWAAYSSNPGKPDSKEGRREIIRRERTIELAFEGKRFWDIRRWKQIDVLNEQPQGWNIKGETPQDFYRVVPIAREPLRFTSKDYFWPIRESDISVNSNLLQNYGW